MRTIDLFRDRIVGDYIVEDSPAICLGKTSAFFDSDAWPYRDIATNDGPGIIGRSVSSTVHSHLFMGSLLGMITMIVLSILTFGLFFVLWVIVAFLILGAEGPTVEVSAMPVGEGRTRVTVKTNSDEHAEPVCSFVQSEFSRAQDKIGVG